jgi:hypothetical protein
MLKAVIEEKQVWGELLIGLFPSASPSLSYHHRDAWKGSREEVRFVAGLRGAEADRLVIGYHCQPPGVAATVPPA